MRNQSQPREYAVAFSYASEQRSFVHAVARRVKAALTGRARKVFYDVYAKRALAGQIGTRLAEIYGRDSDLVVVFMSPGYARSGWCKREWNAVRKALTGRKRPNLLLFACDGYAIPGIPAGHNPTPVTYDDEDQTTDIILDHAGFNRWIVDAHYAASRLDVLRRDRGNWLFEHELLLTNDDTLGGDANDEWKVEPLARLCAGRPLRLGRAKPLPTNIICLRGDHGSGKSILLLRLIASAGALDGVPPASWLVDFTNNMEVCASGNELKTVPAKEVESFLTAHLRRRRRGDRHVLLAVDGLDTAARHLSVVKNETPAPSLAMEALTSICGRLRQLARANPGVSFTLVLSMNPLVESGGEDASDEQSWRSAFEQLRSAKTVFADLQRLPAIDDQSYERIYRPHLKLPNGSRSAVAEYVSSGRDFLRLPLFLDAASAIPSNALPQCRMRSDFLQTSSGSRTVPWPNELDRLSSDLLTFISASAMTVLRDERLRMMLRREWTGAWFELLIEAMRSQRVLGLISDLKQLLLDDTSCRWDLSASFALSNVVTALSESGHAPTFDSTLLFCNLRRATLDRATFDRKSRFQAVDCYGSTFRGVTLADECRFIATDFTKAVWDEVPRNRAQFVECMGLGRGDSE
jgi:hypothetical protein